MGIELKDPKEIMAWWRYCAWKNGISPTEFNNSKFSEIKEIIRIDVAVKEKKLRQSKVNALMHR